MATTKKTTAKKAPVKKTTAKKSSVAKSAPVKTAAKRSPVKKTAVKSVSKKAQKSPKYETLRLSKETADFMSFKITEQTVYWVILASVVIFFQLWILKLQHQALDVIQAQALL